MLEFGTGNLRTLAKPSQGLEVDFHISLFKLITAGEKEHSFLCF